MLEIQAFSAEAGSYTPYTQGHSTLRGKDGPTSRKLRFCYKCSGNSSGSGDEFGEPEEVLRFRVSCPDDVARRVRCLEDRLPNFFHQEPPETSPGPLLSCTQAGVSPNFLAPSPPSHELAVNVTGSAVVLPLLTALWLAQRCAAMPPSFAVNSRRLPVPGFYTSAQGSLYKPNNRPLERGHDFVLS